MRVFSLVLLFQIFAFAALAQSKEVLELEQSKRTIGIISVNTNLAKLTESLDEDSKVLAILNGGQQLELIKIHFPRGTFSAARYEVKMGIIEGYITSYFISPNITLKEKMVVKLKDLENNEAKAYTLKEKQIQDSLTQVKIQQDKASIENRKINLSISDAELGRKNDSIAEIFNAKEKEKALAAREIQRKQDLAVQKERIEKYKKKYGQVNGEKIGKRVIWIGMTEGMLLDSWGQPEDINSTVTRYGSRKQYVYGSGQYVYIENGKVDAWQN
jgi:hypothetical protein